MDIQMQLMDGLEASTQIRKFSVICMRDNWRERERERTSIAHDTEYYLSHCDVSPFRREIMALRVMMRKKDPLSTRLR